jgi:hypothetical protein
LVDPVRVEPTTVSEGAECRTTCGASCCVVVVDREVEATGNECSLGREAGESAITAATAAFFLDFFARLPSPAGVAGAATACGFCSRGGAGFVDDSSL